MKVMHLQSSTQIIHLGDIKVLTDPWLIDGEYYGSWYHYPPFGVKNLEKLVYDVKQNYDYIALYPDAVTLPISFLNAKQRVTNKQIIQFTQHSTHFASEIDQPPRQLCL